jgi:hypothetical protein
MITISDINIFYFTKKQTENGKKIWLTLNYIAYWIWNSSAVFTNLHPEPNRFNSLYCHLFLRYVLILFSHLPLNLPRDLFLAGLHSLLHSYIVATCPDHLVYFITLTIFRWTVWTMKLLIAKASPLPILIPSGPKYSPHHSQASFLYLLNFIF